MVSTAEWGMLNARGTLLFTLQFGDSYSKDFSIWGSMQGPWVLRVPRSPCTCYVWSLKQK